MVPDIMNTFPVRFASQSFRDVSLQEAGQDLHALLTAPHLSVFWESQRILGDAVGQIAVRASPEGPSAEDELICADPKRPPIDCARVAFLDEDLWSHVGHRPRHTGEHLAFRIMDSDIKIGQVGVPLFVQKNVIRFDVPVLVR